MSLDEVAATDGLMVRIRVPATVTTTWQVPVISDGFVPFATSISLVTSVEPVMVAVAVPTESAPK